MYQNILNNTTVITNQFNLDLFITSLKSQLESVAFTELIREEKDGIQLKIEMQVLSDERDFRKENKDKILKLLKSISSKPEIKDSGIIAFELIDLLVIAGRI